MNTSDPAWAEARGADRAASEQQASALCTGEEQRQVLFVGSDQPEGLIGHRRIRGRDENSVRRPSSPRPRIFKFKLF